MGVITVSELNKYIKEKLENDLILANLWLKGEISNFKHHYSGHMYFTLKDSNAAVKCVMFRSRCSRLKFVPEEGMGIIARGNVSVYEKNGQYQLYIEEMQPDGIGALHIAFQQLKERLEKEGLFKKENKKPIPSMPKKVAVITSPTGAAVRDIITVMQRRCPQVEILLVPVQVQGDIAASQIAEAIETINTLSEIDVAIVGRGGGALEELWCFNTEVVARSIYASRIPIISAVGHETDFTIADFVADLRAPTPSAAAELVAADLADLIQRFGNLNERLILGAKNTLDRYRHRVEICKRSPALSRPRDMVNNLNLQLDYLVSGLERGIKNVFADKQGRFRMNSAQLSSLNPLATLQRGYSVVKKKQTGEVLSKVQQFFPGQEVELVLLDGTVDCTVNEIKEDDND